MSLFSFLFRDELAAQEQTLSDFRQRLEKAEQQIMDLRVRPDRQMDELYDRALSQGLAFKTEAESLKEQIKYANRQLEIAKQRPWQEGDAPKLAQLLEKTEEAGDNRIAKERIASLEKTIRSIIRESDLMAWMGFRRRYVAALDDEINAARAAVGMKPRQGPGFASGEFPHYKTISQDE